MTILLDKRLEHDSFLACNRDTIQIRLMNDQQYFWVLLVPIITADEQAYPITELHDLPETTASTLWRYAIHCGQKLKTHTGAKKINTAVIGNIVSQLHLHIVARHEHDIAWPAPMWGHSTMVPLTNKERTKRLFNLQDWDKKISGIM